MSGTGNAGGLYRRDASVRTVPNTSLKHCKYFCSKFLPILGFFLLSSRPLISWRTAQSPPLVLVLLQFGVTSLTALMRFGIVCGISSCLFQGFILREIKDSLSSSPSTFTRKLLLLRSPESWCHFVHENLLVFARSA